MEIVKRLILVRHAERGEINPNTVGNEEPLTKKGEQDAISFGAYLKSQVISINSSPIYRCIQTARLIGESAGFKINNIELDNDLGDPGFIITDGEQAWEHWKTKGHHSVNQHLLSGTDSWDGFSDLEQATSSFLHKITCMLKKSPCGTHVWVTHDTVLATFVSRALKTTLALDHWPNFLSFVEIDLDMNKLEMTYFKHWDCKYSKTTKIFID